jgi:transcriptional regulator with XRE-family HTH domain
LKLFFHPVPKAYPYLHSREQQETMKKKFNRIKAVLAEKDKSSLWLAEQIGRDRSTVSRWCTNDMQPPLEVLYQIAAILEVDVCKLLVREEK